MEDNIKAAQKKLKVILKKTRPNTSLHNLYKRKLKSGHSISSNSPHTVQSLRTCNKLLSASLEKMRQDFHQVHEHYSQLLEKNQELREYVFALRQYQKPDNVVEMEINKKVKERLINVKKKLCILNSLATEFVETLAELSEICVYIQSPRNATPSRLSNSISSPVGDKHFLSADSSVVDGALSTSARTDEIHEKEAAYSGFKRRSSSRRYNSPDLKTNWEHSSEENNSAPFDLLEVSNSASSASLRKKHLLSELQAKFQKPTREPNKLGREHVRNTVTRINEKKQLDVTEKSQRLETFIIASEEFPNNKIISDIARPQFFLENNHDDETEWVDCDAQSPEYISYESTSSFAASSMDKNPKRKHGRKKKGRLKVTSVSSQEELPSAPQSPEKQMVSETHPTYENPTWIQKMKYPKASPKTPIEILNMLKNNMAKGEVSKQSLSTIKELNVGTAFKQHVENSGKRVSYVTTIQRCLPVHERDKYSLFSADSTGNPANEEDSMSKHVGLSSEAAPVGSTDTRDKMGAYLSKTLFKKKNEQKEQIVCEAEVGKFTNDLIARLSQPDEFSFTYKKKYLQDVISKNDPAMHHKVRLKSKRLKNSAMINLLHGKQQTGFDGTSKSPMLGNVNKPKYTEESIMPIPMFLGKNRSSSSNTDEGSHNVTSTEVEISSIDKQFLIFLNEDSVNEVLFKKGSPTCESDYLNRSHTHDKKNNECKNSTGEIRKTKNEMASEQCETENTIYEKMDCWVKSVESCQDQPINKPKPEIVNQSCRRISGRNLMSKDGFGEGIMSDRRVTSDAVSTQGKLNNLESEADARFENDLTSAHEATTNINNPGLKIQRKVYMDERKMNQNAISHIHSFDSRNVKKCDTLRHCFLAVEPEKLGEERVTNEHLTSLYSGVKYIANSGKLKKLLHKIKHKTSSIVRSLSDTIMFNSDMMLNESADTTEKSLFLGVKASHDKFEGKIPYSDGNGNKVVKSDSKSSILTINTHPDNLLNRMKISRNCAISKNSREMSQDDSEIFLKCANFTANRIEKTRNKESSRKISGRQNSINNYECIEASEDDFTEDGDCVSQTYTEVLQDETNIDIMNFSDNEPKQLLEKLRLIRDGTLSPSDESVQPKITLSGSCYNAVKKQELHSRMYQIVKCVQFPERSLSPPTKPTVENNLGRKLHRDGTPTTHKTFKNMDVFRSLHP